MTGMTGMSAKADIKSLAQEAGPGYKAAMAMMFLADDKPDDDKTDVWKEAQPEAKPKPASTPGDLTLAKAAPTPRKEEGDANEAKLSRPRTVKEALARLQQNHLPGEKILQEGGVSRRHEMASLDTKATPFGAYDAALVDAIAQHWYSLLDQREYASDSRGKVVVRFSLHHDGRVTDMGEAENTAGEVLGLICQKAVLDNAPFAAWPSDMRRTLGDVRHIQFTFYYN
jgi:hypothetical protein